MIIKVDNCEYNKVDKLDLKTNCFTLYIQCFKQFSSTNDIYEFKTSTSKVYISAKNVVKVIVVDFVSLGKTIDEIIKEAIEDDIDIVKFVFVSYF